MAQKKNAPKGQKKESKPHQANKNGKKADVGGGASFFTWFMVLAVLGVWTSVAVVYFDLVDYQGVIAKAKDLRYNLSEVLQGKLVSYDTDGDGDFDMEDAKVLVGLTKDGSKENSDSLEEVLDILAEEGTDLFQGFFTFLYDVMSPFDTLEDEETEAAAEDVAELSNSKAVGVKLMEALKQQLAIIHERVEARKIAKMALAEVRSILAKEEEERTLTRIREESEAKAWERAEARLKEEGERIVKEDVEKAMEKIRLEKEEREKAALRDEAKRGENEEVNEKLDVEKPLDKMLNEKGNDPKKAAAKKKP